MIEAVAVFLIGLALGAGGAFLYYRKTDNVKLFVYGDMRIGGPEHDWVQDSPLLIEGSIENYKLASHIEDGQFLGMVPGSEGEFVNGEVYAFPFKRLADLDEHLACWWLRTTLALTDGTPVQAYVFKRDVTWQI